MLKQVEGELFDLAVAALRVEDEVLHDLLKNTPDDVAPGLAYWVFETTLVYTVFKSWLPHAHVSWEHALAAEKSGGTSDKTPLGAKRKCDLVIFEGNEVRAAVEAKWWNNNYSAGMQNLRNDANRLREAYPSASVGKYLMTFWWSEKAASASDRAKAHELLKESGDIRGKLTRVESFDTALRGGEKGDFSVGLIKLS